MGHSRLVTNGAADNQPVYRDEVVVIHNGIIVNDVEAWTHTTRSRHQETNTEIIARVNVTPKLPPLQAR